jgi:hypothetical protein
LIFIKQSLALKSGVLFFVVIIVVTIWIFGGFMIATYSKCIPLINELNHGDKLRLAQWLIKIIAQEEGVNDMMFDNYQTGLCGIWQDSRSGKEISQEIVNNRTQGRDVTL